MSAARLLMVGLIAPASLGRAQAQEPPAPAAAEEVAPAAPQPADAPPAVSPPDARQPPSEPLPRIVDAPSLEVVNGQVVVVSKKRHTGHGYVNVMALGAYRRFFNEDLAAANLELELGGETQARGASFGGRLGVMAGATKVGLPFQHITFGGVVRPRLTSRVYLGIGTQFGILVLNRARAKEDAQWSATLGAYLEPTIDVWKDASNRRLFLVGRVGYDWVMMSYGSDDAHSVTAQLGLGYRF